jgi:hypothetical protein
MLVVVPEECNLKSEYRQVWEEHTAMISRRLIAGERIIELRGPCPAWLRPLIISAYRRFGWEPTYRAQRQEWLFKLGK